MTEETTLSDEEELDEIITKPVISDELMHDLEKASCDKSRGLQRKLTLAACARSLEKLADMRLEDPETFKEMQEMVEEFREHTQGLLEIAKTAVNRIRLADIMDEDPEAFAKACDMMEF